MARVENLRYRFAVPVGDQVVNDWIKCQDNLSFSIRLLIKSFIEENGMVDATYTRSADPVPKRGRPKGSSVKEKEDIPSEKSPSSMMDMVNAGDSKGNTGNGFDVTSLY